MPNPASPAVNIVVNSLAIEVFPRVRGRPHRRRSKRLVIGFISEEAIDGLGERCSKKATLESLVDIVVVFDTRDPGIDLGWRRRASAGGPTFVERVRA